MSWISGRFSHYCVLISRQDSRTLHPKLTLHKFCASWTPIVTSLIFLYCSYISWLELYLFVLLITSYLHIYFLLIKTSIMFYFHLEGNAAKLTVLVTQHLYQLQFYLQKQEYFYFLSVLIFRDGKIMSILILLILLSTTIVTTLSPIERHDMPKRDFDVSLSFYQFWSPHLYIFLMLSRTYFLNLFMRNSHTHP